MKNFLKTLWAKIVYKECISCHRRKPNVKIAEDPFLAEVMHIYRDMPFCENCLETANQQADQFTTNPKG